MTSFPPIDKMIKTSPCKKRVSSPRPLVSARMPPPRAGTKRALIENDEGNK
jgi:hypothetical protein